MHSSVGLNPIRPIKTWGILFCLFLQGAAFPFGRGLVEWPRHDPASDGYLELGDSIRAGSRLRQKQYDLLDDAQAASASTFGKGSTFSLRLPSAPDSRSPATD